MRKRVVVLFCAALVLINCVLFPFRVRASAPVAVAITGAAAVAAYLMSCGIYPTIGQGETFGEWGARKLTNAIAEYNKHGGEMTVQLETIKAYAVGKTIAFSRDTWSRLRAFSSWMVSEFHLTSNKDGVSTISQTGYASYSGLLPYYASGVPSYNTVKSYGFQSVFKLDEYGNQTDVEYWDMSTNAKTFYFPKQWSKTTAFRR